jgi:hypothetical protein
VTAKCEEKVFNDAEQSMAYIDQHVNNQLGAGERCI